ncbi:VWA domain-containing protein [Micromonospora okii]|uniref:VWA domain-containing protein n=1 Tax=Micromonospora okii TaxID=1182970 RepID=UPI001E4792A7|nr:VWA domain-containing protein [Micromonospora okii]
MAGNRFRYGQWRGGPDPLAPPYDVREAVDSVGAEVLAGGSLREALRDLLRRGPRGRGGLDDLAARARRLRQEALRRGDLDGAVTRARALLDQALAAERDELRGRDDEAARFAEAVLDNLPRSTARAVQELEGYDWASDEARRAYRQILDGLRGDVLQQRFAGLRQVARAAADPGAQRQLAAMMRDLNDLLARHARSEETTDAFAEFMRRHGEFFPEQPGDVDELVDVLARRSAAGERLLRSLTDRQREELAGLMRQSLGDGLAGELSALDANLRALRPDLYRGRGERVRGEQPLGYREATGALDEIAELDELLDALDQDQPGATLDDVDVDAVARTLGRDAADDARRLQTLERELRRQGWVGRDAEGLTLSPKALRRLAGTALRRVFADLTAGPRGRHELRAAGASGEVSGASRPWEYGDEQPLDVVGTLTRAVRRAGPGVPVQLAADDFEVVETERRASAAVVLCVDLSYSMFSQGRWGPMKQTALALSHLMATRFPQDALQIVGFGRRARPLTQAELAAVEPDHEKGTNLQHALRLAGRHLRRHPGAEPVVLVVTDGEPTAHLDPDDGEALFYWPPLPETIEATVREVDRLTRAGATLNLFMLGEDPGLRSFVDAVARRCRGRMFTPDLDDLGEYVVSDYLRARRGR